MDYYTGPVDCLIILVDPIIREAGIIKLVMKEKTVD